VANSIFSGNSAASFYGGGIYNFGTLTVTSSTFSGNSAGYGGGMLNDTGHTLTVTNSTFLANSGGGNGGGFLNIGTSAVSNSTFSANSTPGYGGGIFNGSGTMTVTNSTLSNNSATFGNGGGIYNQATLNLKNTIAANSVSGGDCYNNSGDTIASNTSNLIEANGSSGHMCGTPAYSTDPILGTLTDSPAYFPLKAGSPAIDTGDDAICLAAPVGNASQNGITRPRGTHCDIGSFELNLPTSPSFGDVPTSHPYWQDIEILYANGLTAGCSVIPLNFCPDQIMDRAQSSVFVLRGNYGTGYTPPVAPWDRFADDWSPGAWAEKWAEGMYNAGLTAGCATGPLRYCPWDQTPKVQAAVFGLRLKYGNSYVPAAATGTVFFDMTDTAYFGTKWAEKAYADGLLPNCGTDVGSGKPLFCPNDPVSRGLGAYMIVRAKSLSMP
jgi:hypothetical protein